MDIYTTIALWIFVVYVYHVKGTDDDIYTNKFAIKFHGQIEEVKRFARDHGYTFHGQIGSLENHYLLEHPHVYRRSALHSEDHHEHLRAHPQIHWFEQQKLLSRKKRDFIEMPAEVLLNNHMSDLGLEKESSHRHRRDTKRERPDLTFNDPLYPKMWYYHGGGLNHTDMNVMGAWKRGVTGKNVVITILDDGIERTHSDLKDNYDPYASYDVNAHDSDPMPRYDYANTNRHGTRCAGEVSAKANNNFCVVGVAYDSKIGGVRMLDGDVFDAVEAASLGHNRSHIDIYSASWGPDDDGRVVDGPGVLAKSAFKDGVAQGRNGKGSIFVWASGNGGNTKDSCNCDGYTNSIYTLSISSISQHGRKPWYLEECSSTLATTYSSGTYNEKQIGRNGKGAIFVWASGNGGRMADSCSCDGYTNSIYTISISGISQRMSRPFYLEECASTLATTFSSGSGSEQKVITDDLHNKCTELHTGTSASAPLAAGIVALILEVKPDLTWRDVQYITLMTARPLPDGVWVTNGVGRQVSLRYGYGLMDATAMVELAEKWTTVPAQHICEVKNHNGKVDIPDSGYEEMLDTEACAGLNNSVNYLEHVQVKFNISSKRRGDLVIHITSPMGTKSTILPQRPNDGDSVKGFKDWAFLSVHFWGENPVGRWKLQIEVRKSSRSYYGGKFAGARRTNELVNWSLILYGTEENPVNLVQPTPPTAQPTGQTEGASTTSSTSSTTSSVSLNPITESASSSTQLNVTSSLPSVTPTKSNVTPTQQNVTSTQLSVTNKTTQVSTTSSTSSTTSTVSLNPITESASSSTQLNVTPTLPSVTPTQKNVTTTQLSVTNETTQASTTSSTSSTTSTVSVNPITESASSSTQLNVTPSQPIVTPTQINVTTTQLSITNETIQTCSSQCLGGCTGPGPDKCESCRNYKMEDTGLCVQSCPNNFYAQGFICKKCMEECETCTMITASQVMCLKCKPGYLLVEGKGTCRTFCEKGYYKDNQSHHCRVCSGNCAECSERANTCTACRWGMELLNNKCVPEKIPCPAGQYKVNTVCKECPKGCFTCTSATNCTCCNIGSYLQDGVCVNSCDNGYLPFHVNYSSEIVFQQCQHCDNECSLCPDGFKKVKGVCVQQSNCPDGMYFQWNSMSCKLCNASCKTCIGPGARDCLSCFAPFGYHSLLRQCMKCCSSRDKSQGRQHCCACVEEGKCDLQMGTEAAGDSINKVVIVFIVITLLALLTFGVIFLVIYHQRKQNPRSEYSYSKLQENEINLLADADT